jgi:hypothetical protein
MSLSSLIYFYSIGFQSLIVELGLEKKDRLDMPRAPVPVDVELIPAIMTDDLNFHKKK